MQLYMHDIFSFVMFPVGIIVAILMHLVLLLIYIRQSCELSSSMPHPYASSKKYQETSIYPNHRIINNNSIYVGMKTIIHTAWKYKGE